MPGRSPPRTPDRPAPRWKSATDAPPPIPGLADRHRAPTVSTPDVRAITLGGLHPLAPAITGPQLAWTFSRIPTPLAAAPRDTYRGIVRAATSTRRWSGSKQPGYVTRVTRRR